MCFKLGCGYKHNALPGMGGGFHTNVGINVAYGDEEGMHL